MAKTYEITKREGSPDYVLGSFGVKPADIEPYTNVKGYINFEILRRKDGAYYVKVSEYGVYRDREENAQYKMNSADIKYTPNF